MCTRSNNPLLPKPTGIRWRKGPLAEKRAPGAEKPGAPASEAAPKPARLKSKRAAPKPPAQLHPKAGVLSFNTGAFFLQSNSGWGSNLDMVPLSHGAVGCGEFAQTSRLNMPEFTQGIESFTALHACTNLVTGDIEDGGDAKLAQALIELKTLFPLAGGVTILNEPPIALIDANVRGIAKTRAKDLNTFVVPVPCNDSVPWEIDKAFGLKTAARHHKAAQSNTTDVAITFYREAAGLVWIVSKLLRDIGLNPVHEHTGSSSSDMARLSQCKLAIGFNDWLEGPPCRPSPDIRQWCGIPLLWTCFLGPTATDGSLRAIVAHFGPQIQLRAEQVIAANRKKLNAAIARYRPRLEGKLALIPTGIPEGQREGFHLLGMRVGNQHGWPGKTGVWRTPRLTCNWGEPRAKAFDAYIAETSPDFVHNTCFDEYDWKKRGIAGLAFSPFYCRGSNFLWGYDSFEPFAAALDREVNAPWRKLLKPPWPQESG